MTRFASTWGNVYNGTALEAIPWYVVGGYMDWCVRIRGRCSPRPIPRAGRPRAALPGAPGAPGAHAAARGALIRARVHRRLGNATAERAFTTSSASRWQYPSLWHSINVLVPPDYSTLQIIMARGVSPCAPCARV